MFDMHVRQVNGERVSSGRMFNASQLPRTQTTQARAASTQPATTSAHASSIYSAPAHLCRKRHSSRSVSLCGRNCAACRRCRQRRRRRRRAPKLYLDARGPPAPGTLRERKGDGRHGRGVPCMRRARHIQLTYVEQQTGQQTGQCSSSKQAYKAGLTCSTSDAPSASASRSSSARRRAQRTCQAHCSMQAAA